jgi:G:T-mismatch repair DNA endonuclease (very short patch repair protein)
LPKKVDIWNFELEKINLAKNSGYRVMVIWESDFLDNKINTIEKVKKWILNEQL